MPGHPGGSQVQQGAGEVDGHVPVPYPKLNNDINSYSTGGNEGKSELYLVARAKAKTIGPRVYDPTTFNPKA